MSDLESCRNHAVVIQPGESASYWQPKPANGHADPTWKPSNTKFGGLSMGYQTISPNGRIRAHPHREQVELQICFSGRGHVEVNGERHELVPGTACFLGPEVRHEIFNNGEHDLVQLWVIGPAGLADFFQTVGRPRMPGEAPPAPFERPSDVVEIERSMGFEGTKA